MGETYFMTLLRFCLALAFLLWGARARFGSKAIYVALLPLGMQIGRQMMPQGQLISRAIELEVGKVQALAVPSTMSSLLHMVGPTLNLALYNRVPQLPFAFIIVL